jgi:hypothetical protein
MTSGIREAYRVLGQAANGSTWPMFDPSIRTLCEEIVGDQDDDGGGAADDDRDDDKWGGARDRNARKGRRGQRWHGRGN